MATLKVQTKTTIEIEVTYPMYFKNNSETEIVKMNSEHDGIEIKKDSIKKTNLSATDFYGMYSPATEEEFNKLFQECMTSISSILMASDIELLPKLQPKKERSIEYFLFGEVASKQYSEIGRDFVFTSDGGYALYVFDDYKHDIMDFVDAYDGWDGFAKIPKEDYEFINNYLTNN